MATIKFIVKGKSSPVTIYIRVRDGRNIDFTLSTSKTINRDYWNENKGWIRGVSEFMDKVNLTTDLTNLKNLVETRRNESVTSYNQINKEWLENIILDWKGENAGGESDLLTDRIESYVTRLPTRVRNGKIGVAAGSLRNYNTAIQRLKKFELFKKKRFRITEIDLTFHEEFIKYAQKGLNLSMNSIGNTIRNIKTVCLDSKDMGFKVNEQVLSRNFNAPSEKTVFTTLSELELRTIKEKDLKGVSYLENARDWLVIGCWTGCRVGDLMKLNKQNIMLRSSGESCIQYVQSKTGKMVVVPVHSDVQGVLDKSNGFPRPISAQKFNEYIKIVCRLSGLVQRIEGTKQNKMSHLKESGVFEKWELIRSHTCRRSFASNHYNKLPNKLIMAVTGHTTERMLLNYIGEVEVDHVEDFFDLWKAQKDNKVRKIDSDNNMNNGTK